MKEAHTGMEIMFNYTTFVLIRTVSDFCGKFFNIYSIR